MGLLTNNKLLTETENIAPKKKPEQPAKQERSAAEKSRNDKRYRARFTPVKKKENAQKATEPSALSARSVPSARSAPDATTASAPRRRSSPGRFAMLP